MCSSPKLRKSYLGVSDPIYLVQRIAAGGQALGKEVVWNAAMKMGDPPMPRRNQVLHRFSHSRIVIVNDGAAADVHAVHR
jgi:hypothetical protein